MNKNHTYLAIFAIMVLIVLVYLGSHQRVIITPTESLPASSVTATTTAILKLDEQRTFGDTLLVAWAVTEDSRCPSDVQCIQAGRVLVAVNASSTSHFSTFEMEIGKTYTTENLKITLDQVSPYPISTRKIADDEYRFTFTVAPHSPNIATGRCYVGGCGGQLCTDKPDIVSTCEFRAEYACYKQAVCERQISGACGWTETPGYKMCLVEVAK